MILDYSDKERIGSVCIDRKACVFPSIKASFNRETACRNKPIHRYISEQITEVPASAKTEPEHRSLKNGEAVYKIEL